MSLADHQELLQELLAAYGPCGQEDDVRAICLRELAGLVHEVSVDPAGNVVGLLRGDPAGPGAPVVRVTAHLDELSMMVKRVEPDGTLAVQQLGAMNPGNFGLGPVTILADDGPLQAALVLGSEHTTVESQRIWETKPEGGDKALDWRHVYVFTGRTQQELRETGVHPGTRVVIDRSRRTLVRFAHHMGCYFLDDRAAVTALLVAARLLRDEGRRPAGDAYLVFTTSEELGGVGATWASHHLPGDVTLALDVGAAEAEYQTTVESGPIVAYADDAVVYDRALADHLVRLGRELGLDPAQAVFASYDSDASQAKSHGLAAQAALVSLPTLSTHGFEVMRDDTVERTARLVAAYLVRPVPAG
ncbi:MAG TPA: hypothetical protein VGD03_07695 [Frankiaceae bacterium]